MANGQELTELVRQISSMVQATAVDRNLENAEVRRVLSFISQVIQVVEQAFQDVLTLLLDIQYLNDSDRQTTHVYELRKRVKLLTARSYYRDAAEICSRLKHLRENYEEFIRPSVQRLQCSSDWQGVFGLIEEREGRIICIIEQTAREIAILLDKADSGQAIDAKAIAAQKAEQLRELLAELHNLNGRILGLSGHAGFLELTQDRNQLRQEVNLMIDSRDQSITHGPKVSVNGSSTFHGDFIVAGAIQDSFNRAKDITRDDIKEKLQALCIQVEQMSKGLPKDVAAEIANDLTTFVNEVAKDQPRRKWYELSSEGLVEAAKSCAGLASPVIKTVKEILALLT